MSNPNQIGKRQQEREIAYVKKLMDEAEKSKGKPIADYPGSRDHEYH